MKKRLIRLAAVTALASGFPIFAVAQEGTASPTPAPKPSSPPPTIRRVSPPPGGPAAALPRPPAPAPVPIKPEDEEKILYTVGVVLGRETAVFALTPAEVEQVKKGFADALAGTAPQVPIETFGPQIRPLAQARQARRMEAEKEKGRIYLAQAAKEPGAVQTDSGLVFIEKTKGSGPNPKPTDKVKVNYHGTLVDGTVFDTTRGRDPAEFLLNGVVACWTEGVQKMSVGGKATLACPPSIAYGDGGRPGIPGGATLVFEVELLGIVAPPSPSPAASAAPGSAPVPSPRAAPSASPPTTPPPSR